MSQRSARPAPERNARSRVAQLITEQPFLRGSLVELVVMLAETHITTQDLIGLRVGDIITTENDVRQPLLVNVEGVSKFRAKPGQHKGQKAITIENGIEKQK